MIPRPDSHAYDAALAGTAFMDRPDRAWIVVSGNDRRSYLQGLFTNDIEALTAGRGCYTAYLTPQGRMIADLWVYELGDLLLLSVAREVKATILEKLDQFIFTEDVKLGDVTENFAAIAVIGGEAAAVLSGIVAVDRATLEALPEHGNLRAEYAGQPAIVLRTTDTGVAGYDLLVDVGAAASLRAALHAGGAVALNAATADAIRVQAGVPKFHVDMDEDIIPLEAGIQARAISMTKGCYVGQEVIVRVLHRGHGRVAKRLVGLALPEDASPARGAEIRAGDKAIGTVTSVAWSIALGHPVALGYVHRDFVAPGSRVSVDGYDAVVRSLPFDAPVIR
jgi:folate-binding protein YgfZ